MNNTKLVLPWYLFKNNFNFNMVLGHYYMSYFKFLQIYNAMKHIQKGTTSLS